jgi:predicted CoA-substrate-specific enzyme activase
MMIAAGIDVGGKNVHVIIIKDGRVVARGLAPARIKKEQAAVNVFNDAIKNAGIKREDVEYVVATGSARKRMSFTDSNVPDAIADSCGVLKLIPSARTIVDIGAEESLAIKVSGEGKVLGFVVNDKCASGTGTFVDAMARALEVSVEEMAQISLRSTTSIQLNAQCAVFGESEVVSLIHSKTPKSDIARAVHDAIAGRISSLIRIVGIEKDVVMIGGVANNRGVVDSLGRDLGIEVIVPDSPDYMGALGAALIAEQTCSRNK